MSGLQGTEKTKTFYDTEGWHTNEDGHLVDVDLFGFKENGTIRKSLFDTQWGHIFAALERLGNPVDLLEVGCGGAPEPELLPYCKRYTGVDFSDTGISVARRKFREVALDHRFEVADACHLPFDDASFDAVYSAHMLYHIEDAGAQKQALEEAMRVLKPGGVLILTLANPRPVLFPLRAVKRMVASSPLLKRLSERLRGPAVLPYNPQSIGWTKSVLGPLKDVQLVSGGMASTWVNQNISETKAPGRWLWKGIQRLETQYPKVAAYLGNYVVYLCRK